MKFGQVLYVFVALLLCVVRAQLASDFMHKTTKDKKLWPKCGGTVQQNCDPCYKAQKSPLCDRMEIQCMKTFCLPLCLELTWACDVEASGCSGWDKCEEFEKEVNSERVKKALCAQFKAEGCSRVVDCCSDENQFLYKWVEGIVYDDYFPTPQLPIPVCMHDARNQTISQQMCDACKNTIKVTLSEMECSDNFPPWPTEHQQPQNMAIFSKNMVDGAKQIPKHKGMEDRCLSVNKKMKTKFEKMKKLFEDKACDCLGCCNAEPTCFYPLTYTMV
eukprot:GILK01011917.1.p1 GENE.GILK01011917.1~~GILK01011917.1.p1  ORF type:complete len:274 (-),score=30.25 GILK01011917.1:310-1131(-)